ncbi:MAG: hypothetical protein QOD60_538 [Solirubrobacterales bacterium]|jgi:hypothetical protein|nr:hypothetical protein [Solirubrobacterales bacterium]
MSKKRFAIVALVVSIGATGVIGASGASGQSPYYNQAPTVTLKKKAKFKSTKASVGKVVCGTGTCKATSASVKVKIAGSAFKASLKVPNLGAGSSGAITLKLSKSARSALGAAGKGTAKIAVTVASTNGLTASAKRKVKISA